MGFFGKLFDKKVCDLCGGEIGLLGNRKLEDGNCCKECAAKLSPWFDERRHSTVEQIQRQITAREENRRKLQNWNHDLVFGEYQKLYVKFAGRIPDTFVISSASNYREANADIIDFSNLSSCDADIQESRRELKQKNAQGEEISFNPPRYEYSYEFYVKLMVMGCEYIDDMRFRLNRNTLKLQTIQRGANRNMMFSQTFDPMLYPEYRELKNELDNVCRLFSCGQQGIPYEGNAAGGDGIQSLLEQIRNAPDLETAMQLQAALSLMTITNPNKEHINARPPRPLPRCKTAVCRAVRRSIRAMPTDPSCLPLLSSGSARAVAHRMWANSAPAAAIPDPSLSGSPAGSASAALSTPAASATSAAPPALSPVRSGAASAAGPSRRRDRSQSSAPTAAENSTTMTSDNSMEKECLQ